MESRNWINCARARGSLNMSTPPDPAERWVTFCITWSNDVAMPLWKNVWGKAKIESSDGGLNPSAPSGAAALARTSLPAPASNVPTFINWPMISALTMTPDGGGATKFTRLLVHCEVPWQLAQFACWNNWLPATTSGSVFDSGEIGERMPL